MPRSIGARTKVRAFDLDGDTRYMLFGCSVTGRFFSGGVALTPATVINIHSSDIANFLILLFSVV